LPPGWIPPPGVIVPPNYTVPGWWIPFTYFILPGGLTWEQIFPAGWTPKDPLPPGVSLLPGTVLPDNFTPANPPPAWFTPGGGGPTIPPGGTLPPTYLPPPQSPPHRPQPTPPAGFPEITGFYFKVTRGDGTVIDDSAELDGYFDVYNSSEDWIASTLFTYDPATEYWAVTIDPGDIDENGYFIFIDYEDGIETQYPFRYKDDDQWDPADLTQFGIYEADVPYWIVSGQTDDPGKDFAYPNDAENQYGWDDVLGFPVGWGSATVNVGVIRTGYYYFIDESVGPIKKSRTVKSSIPYSVRYRSETRTTFPTGNRWAFYLHDVGGFGTFDDAFKYTLTVDGVETEITDGVGLLTETEYEASVEGAEHSMFLEVTPRVGGCKFLCLRYGDGCSVTPQYQ